MTAQGPELRALADTLREHEWGLDYECRCGQWIGKRYYHADHVAEVISALERAAAAEGEKAEAWDEGRRAGSDAVFANHEPSNPYRSAS